MAEKKKKRKNSRQFNRQFRSRVFSSKSILVLCMALIIMIALAVACIIQNNRGKKYEKQVEELTVEIDNLKRTNESLEKEKQMMGSDEYVRKIAKEKLGMVEQDEYILEKSDEKE